MRGVEEFVEFCHDEFWDLEISNLGQTAILWMDIQDPRYEPFLDFLKEVMRWVGIVRVEPMPEGFIVVFDECGARWPSMVFRVRSTFKNKDHIDSATRRDLKDQIEVLRLYSLQGQVFKRGFIHPAIRRLQEALNAHGFSCPEDGKWGLKTRYQLWRFRRRHHLFTPPFIDSHTLDALEV